MFTYFKKKLKVIEKFRDKNESLIKFEELKKIPMATPIEIIPERPGAIVTTRIPSNLSKQTLSFRVEMKKGEKWSPHFHDCWEIIIVYKGRCKDLISGKIATEKNQMLVKPDTLHSIECMSDEAIFYVEFNKNF